MTPEEALKHLNDARDALEAAERNYREALQEERARNFKPNATMREALLPLFHMGIGRPQEIVPLLKAGERVQVTVAYLGLPSVVTRSDGRTFDVDPGMLLMDEGQK